MQLLFVTKEKRNLDLIAGIDANNKPFICFHCFMQSKQAHAYTLDVGVAAQYLLTDNISEYF